MTLTMSFDTQVESGALYFAKAGAVKDARGVLNTPGSVGRPTTAPNLVSVSDLIGKTQFDFAFDGPVTSPAADHFAVYAANGTRYPGQIAVLPSSNVLRVAFPEIEKFGSQITLAAADDSAVHANDGSNASSTLGSRAIGPAVVAAERTSGPDLVSVSIDNATGHLRYIFDKPVDDNQAYDPRNFTVVTRSGDIVKARYFVEVDGDSVLVAFDEPVAAAAESVATANGAVKDFQGQANPQGTVAPSQP
jgi:hypothetical protein